MKKQIVSDGTEWGSDEWYENRWNSVPEELKNKIISHLCKLDNLDEVKEASNDPLFHMFGGMGVRNYLREIILDDELPFAPYPNGKQYQNWDDYYKQALDAS
jgi:hypothetical protein